MSHLTSTLILLAKCCLAVPICIECVGMGIEIVMNTSHTHTHVHTYTTSLNFLIYKMGIKLSASGRHCESNERRNAKVYSHQIMTAGKKKGVGKKGTKVRHLFLLEFPRQHGRFAWKKALRL